MIFLSVKKTVGDNSIHSVPCSAPATRAYGVLLAVVIFFLCSEGLYADTSPYRFQINLIDKQYGGNGKPGWVRAGDMDNDGELEIVAGGGRALFVYKKKETGHRWQRSPNLDSTGNMGANAAVLYDVDADGDLDVVCAQYYGDVGWWENPGEKSFNGQWPFHFLLTTRWFMHDIILADLEQDGKQDDFIANLNSAYWDTKIRLVHFTVPHQKGGAAVHTDIEPGRPEGPLHGHAGLDVGDIDRDGDVDIAFSNGWYESTSGSDGSRSWQWHPVVEVYGISNALLQDIDGDGDLDLVMSAGHHGQGVYWAENQPERLPRSWKTHAIDDGIPNPEGLAAEDLNNDGAIELIACQLDFKRWSEPAHQVYVFERRAGSNSWRKYNIAPNSYPAHQLRTVDIDNDGRLDIISEGAGYGVVTYMENRSGM